MQLTAGSLFDGIGGFPYAAELSGIKPVWASEIEPFPIAVTKQRFPDMLHLGSVTDINGADIPPVDIITFGSPCQDLSVAGQRAGLDGARSGLFSEAVRIIYEMREATNGRYPTFAVWENVPGAFSSNKGRDFRTVLEEITKTDIPMPRSGRWASAGVVRGGAVCAAWRVLDAQHWGVPQRRKRIYLIASFGDNSAETILFKPDSVRRYLTPSGTQRERAATNTETSTDRPVYVMLEQHPNDSRIKIDNRSDTAGANGKGVNENVCFTLNTVDRHSVVYAACFNGQNSITAANINFDENNSPPLTVSKQTDIIYAIDRAAFNQGANAKYNFEISGKGINSTLVAKGPGAVCMPVYAMRERQGCAGGGKGPLFQTDKSGTVVCNNNQTVFVPVNLKYIVRRLTPLECERLQGYPDGWTRLPEIDSMSDAETEFWQSVIKLHKEINGKQYKPVKNVVKWRNKLQTDGARYKALGNSLAIPCALRVISGIAEYVKGVTDA